MTYEHLYRELCNAAACVPALPCCDCTNHTCGDLLKGNCCSMQVRIVQQLQESRHSFGQG